MKLDDWLQFTNGSIKCSPIFKDTSQILVKKLHNLFGGRGGGHQKIKLDYRGGSGGGLGSLKKDYVISNGPYDEAGLSLIAIILCTFFQS